MHKDNVLNVLQQSDQKRARFLDAWKHGVEFLGPQFFGPGSPETARTKEELRPLKGTIEALFEEESEGEEQFLAYRIECHKSLSGLTLDLDHECTEIICELLLNHEGW
jgi:hypothetical protein